MRLSGLLSSLKVWYEVLTLKRISKLIWNTCACCCMVSWNEAEALVCQRRFILVWGGAEWQKQGRGGDLIVAAVAPVVTIVGAVVLVVDPNVRNTFEVVYIIWSTINHFDLNIPSTTLWTAPGVTKADLLWSTLVNFSWVTIIQPPRWLRVASFDIRTWSRHLCPCLAFKAKPTGYQSTVTFSWPCYKGRFSVSISKGFVVLTT